MSLVHKVIILNKPLKIRGFTIGQWVILAVSVALALFLAFKVPQDWKIGNLPIGLFVFIIIFGGALAGVNAAEFKPFVWWRNLFLYKVFNTLPRAYYPNVEEHLQIYPDPDVIDPIKREDQNYIELE